MNHLRFFSTWFVVMTYGSLATADDVVNERVRPFLATYCVTCHGKDLAEGDLRLDNLVADFVNRPAADHWIEVLDRIQLAEMPPEDEPQPTEDELRHFVDWGNSRIAEARHQMESTGGRVLLRRLTRREYANSVRDLLQVSFDPGSGPVAWLPPDGSIRGFDRNSQGLLVDPSLMSAYLDVAWRVADRAIRFRPPLVPERTVRYEYRDVVDTAMKYQIDQRTSYLDGDTLVLLQGTARSFARLRHPFNDREVPKSGRYRVRIQAAAEAGDEGGPIYMRVQQGPDKNLAQFRVDAPPHAPAIYELETIRDELLQGEYQIEMVEGTGLTTYVGYRGQLQREADAMLQSGQVELATTLKARLRAQGEDIASRFTPEAWDLEALPKLRLDWIEVTGPLQGDYPPESMTSFFVDGWAPGQQNLDTARRAFAKFLPRAYRRPVLPSEVDEVTELVAAELAAGNSFEVAIKTGIVATLCSPKFLYLMEPNDDPRPRTLNAFELATRLSYFLWSSQPDETLFRDAAQARLLKRDVLISTVDRMLADPKVEGFLDGFVRQWLKINEFDRFPPDQAIFPDFYSTHLVGVEEDLLEQPIATVREILASDGSLLDLLDSDWAMLNERLASLYKLEGIQGEQFRRVDLATIQPRDAPKSVRGGLLGMGGFHRWGSDGSRTKPVDRGKYLLDVLFNDPPPPPPPNAGEIEPNVRGAKLSVAQRLALHREQTSCQNCHRRIDPYGLALENFNVIGQWRTHVDGERPLTHWGDDRPAILILGRLPNGETYDSFESFKALIVQQQDRFLRGLTEKLLMYGLGRTLEPADRTLVDQVVQTCQSDGYTLRSMIHAIVTSETFRQK